MLDQAELTRRASQIQLVIFDVDGVLTDGSLYYSEAGELTKKFCVKDGLGIKVLMHHQIDVAIISARKSPALARRVQDLGIPHYFPGVEKKLDCFRNLLKETHLAAESIAYLGDDVIDLPVMTQVGLAMAVQDAHKLVLQQAHWTSTIPGGRGAAREACDLILESRMPLSRAYQHITG